MIKTAFFFVNVYRNFDFIILFRRLDQEVDCDWTGLKFSPDGRYILITTNGSAIRLVDAFDGVVKHNLTGHVNDVGSPLEACFSPDSHYIFSGFIKLPNWGCLWILNMSGDYCITREGIKITGNPLYSWN